MGLSRVAVIDYGSGNLCSVVQALRRAAVDCNIAAEIALVNRADALRDVQHIVLPGVGAYADCRRGLDGLDGMVEALREAVLKQAKPFLGICVGMQLLSDVGFEKETTAGLGWIAGEVVPLRPVNPQLKIPQIGWNQLELTRPHPLFDGIKTGIQGDHAYFVHSYHFKCQEAQNELATTDYGGRVTAAIARDNIVGTQFHPEKSQRLGLRLLANFLSWQP